MGIKRRIDETKLINWLDNHGKCSLAELAFKAQVSPSLLQKLKYGYPRCPKKSTMIRIADAMGLELDDLFPVRKL